MKSDRIHGREILACGPRRGEAGDVAGGSGSLGWPCVAIGTLCEHTAVEDPQSRPSFRYVDISSIDRISKEIVEAQEIDGLAAPSRARKAIRAGDVLVSTVRPNLNAVAIVPDHLDGQIASTGFAVLRPKRQGLGKRYLYYYCCTPEFVAALSAKVRGAQYPAVSDEDVRNVSIPLPPPSEQRRIVEILDQADRLRRLRAEADAKADRILPALFIKMFGDPAANPRGWVTKKLSQVAKTGSGGTPATKRDDFYGGDIPWVKSGELACRFVLSTEETITEEGLRSSSAKWVEPGAILVAMYGATVGQVSLLGLLILKT